MKRKRFPFQVASQILKLETQFLSLFLMKTIETTAIVTESGKLTVQLPSDIAPGEYKIVLVIDETLSVKETHLPLKFSDYPVGLASDDFTFRREDLYRNDE